MAQVPLGCPKGATVNATVRFPYGGMKYLIFIFFGSCNGKARYVPRIRRKVRGIQREAKKKNTYTLPTYLIEMSRSQASHGCPFSRGTEYPLPIVRSLFGLRRLVNPMRHACYLGFRIFFTSLLIVKKTLAVIINC